MKIVSAPHQAPQYAWEYVPSDAPAATASGISSGLFIALEGLEGSGKTTQARRLTEALRAEGYTVHCVGEPGGTAYGQAARRLFLETHHELVPEAEVGLLLTCKAQLLQTVIEPALKAGEIVVCDRYTDTLFAYQHHAKGHSLEMMQGLLAAFNATRMPDLTLLLKVSPATSVERTRARQLQGGEFNSLDASSLEFRQKIAQGLESQILPRTGDGLPLAEVIDAEQGPEQVWQELYRIVQTCLQRSQLQPRP